MSRNFEENQLPKQNGGSITPALGKIIILNGSPRSGKSSIVSIIQETFDGIWMNLGVDKFMSMTPEKFSPGIGLRPGERGLNLNLQL